MKMLRRQETSRRGQRPLERLVLLEDGTPLEGHEAAGGAAGGEQKGVVVEAQHSALDEVG